MMVLMKEPSKSMHDVFMKEPCNALHGKKRQDHDAHVKDDK